MTQEAQRPPETRASPSATSRTEQPRQLEALVDWLAEQRKAEREQVQQVLREVERLGQVTRDSTTKVGLIEDEVRTHRTPTSRMPVVEEALRQARDAVSALQQQVSEAREAAEHQTLLRAVELDRDRRTIAEVSQRVGEANRTFDQHQGRVQTLAEEARRDRAAVTVLPAAIEELTRKVTAQLGRLQQLDEQNKRTENQFGAIQQRDEQSRADLARLDNWQRLADVRWNRQIGDWQQQVQVLKEQLDEQSKPIQIFTRQAVRIQDDVQGLSGRLVEQQKRFDEQINTLTKLDGLLTVVRESAARAESAAEAQRRRVDEQVAGLYRLDERIQRSVAQLGDLEHRADSQGSRLEELNSLVRSVDSQRQRAEDGVSALQVQARELRSDLSEQVVQLQTQLAADRLLVAARFTELIRAVLMQRRNQLASLQQEVQEWSTLARAEDEKSSDS